MQETACSEHPLFVEQKSKYEKSMQTMKGRPVFMGELKLSNKFSFFYCYFITDDKKRQGDEGADGSTKSANTIGHCVILASSADLADLAADLAGYRLAPHKASV